MRVSWYLRRRKRNFLRACRFAEDEGATRAGTHMDRQSAAQIRQRKRALAITAIGCSDQLEQRFVFRNWQQLSIAKHPAGGREVACEHSNFTDIWFTHNLVLLLKALEFKVWKIADSLTWLTDDTNALNSS
jgi:hypothetical protein